MNAKILIARKHKFLNTKCEVFLSVEDYFKYRKSGKKALYPFFTIS